MLAACGGGGGTSATPAGTTNATTGASGTSAAGSGGTTAAGTSTGAAGGASSGSAQTLVAGAGCTLQYTLTGSPVLTGTDPLLAQQWHLRNVGQGGGTPGEDTRARDAWTTTRGQGVRVAVIDDSIEVLHPDLRPNLVDGASRSYRAGNAGGAWPLPCTADDDHGTAVAGILLARDDNLLGGAGVAPRASLVAFDALSSGLDLDVADALTRQRDVNAVYHNSWGSPDDGALHAAEAAFVAAIDTGISSGRGGLGAVYVFAAGNGGCYRRSPAGDCLSDDDANFDGYVNQRGVIAVCAVDAFGRRATYSENGANLVVCAPSSGSTGGVTTTALQGRDRSDFGGTSAAAPMVSGVAALMLSVNPTLTWRDVRLILAGTARRNDPTHPDWLTTPSGRPFSHRYGFGVVDAQAAVEQARTWTSVGGYAQSKKCGPYSRTPALALRDPLAGGTLQPATDAVSVAGCAITQIEWVEVTLDASHPYAGDLRVRLTSPGGLVSRLAEGRVCAGACGNYADWRFGSMRHLGERPDGTWSLEVVDTDADALGAGTLNRWSVTFHGR